MKYAVIKTGGKQYQVSLGQNLDIDKIEGKENDKVEFNQVLLINDGKKVLIGQPTITKAKVEAKIESQFRDKKIRVAKFKAKSKYRRVQGHRQPKTRINVLKISSG